jgi:hypothetical protein
MTTLRNHLISVANTFAAARGLSRSRVSTIVFNSGMVLDRLTAGRDLTTGNYERAMQWFSDNWPEGAVWPADVPRPSSGASSPEAA